MSNKVYNLNNTVTKYKGFFIHYLYTGYFETHLGDDFGFIKADTLKGLKKEINAFLESAK